MLVVLAKLGSPEMVGQFALGLTITAPIILGSNLGLRSVQATDAQYEYPFKDYLRLRIITTGFALLVIVSMVLVTGYSGDVALTIFVIGLAKSFEALSDIHWGLFQRYERMDQIAISKMLRGPLLLAGLSAGVYLTGSILIGVVGFAMAQAVVFLSYDVRNAAPLLKIQSDTLLDAEASQPELSL
jgi:O-antigen/teichoic acid export membrane protein